MPFRITIPLVLVLLFAAVGVIGTFAFPTLSTARDDRKVIKVVSSLPRSGSARGQTDTIVKGLKLALKAADNDEVAAALKQSDDEALKRALKSATPEVKLADATYRLEYLDLDDATAAAGQWTIEQEITNATVARSDPDVMVYVGTYNSGAARVSMPILNRAGVLMVSPANTAESLTKPGTGERHEPDCYRPRRNPDGTPMLNYVRVVPTDDLQSELSVQFIADDLKAKTIYILDDNEVYGQGIAKSVHKLCEQRGITVLGHESINFKAQEFSAQAIKIKNTNGGQGPDVVYFGGTTQTKAGQVLKDLAAAGYRKPMMGPDGTHERAMAESADAATFEQVPFYATFGGPTVDGLKAAGGKGAEFVRLYAAEYGGDPEDSYAAYGYECGLVVLEAIKRAGTKDRDAIRRAGVGLKNFTGACGTFSFDENGDTTNRTMTVSTVKDNKLVFVKSLLKK
jgi:branched-chain amino acid transport system substrate-binding protein